MIETRTLALVVGAASLAFGIWAATGAPSEVGLAAGALGLIAGLTTMVPRGTREGAPHHRNLTAASGSDQTLDTTTGAEVNEDEATGVTMADGIAASAPGHLGLDQAHDQPSGTPTGSDAATGHAEPTSLEAIASETTTPCTQPEDDGGNVTAAATPLTDPLTGLFSEDYLVVALEGRLASARRHLRPVALAVLQITQGLPATGSRRADPRVVADAISETVRDSDIACRLGDGTFGVILEDTPENGAVWTVERIRRNLVSSSGHHTLWAGVACYPAHAFDAGELMTQVRVALDLAREWNQDRIEVAVAE